MSLNFYILYLNEIVTVFTCLVEKVQMISTSNAYVIKHTHPQNKNKTKTLKFSGYVNSS